MKTLYESLGGTYRKENEVFLPNLKLPEQTDYTIGKYGQMRRDFLKKHRRGSYTTLLTEGRLFEHSANTDGEARSMVDMTSELAKKQGISRRSGSARGGLQLSYVNNRKCHTVEPKNRGGRGNTSPPLKTVLKSLVFQVKFILYCVS